MAKKTRVKKRRVRLAFDEGLVFVHSSFNNTIITLTDRAGNVLAWSSGGKIGYKGSRKSTPFAAQMAAKTAAEHAMEQAGLQSIEVYVKGPGIGREAAARSLFQTGLNISKIKDITPVPHNGCRPKKRRRV